MGCGVTAIIPAPQAGANLQAGQIETGAKPIRSWFRENPDALAKNALLQPVSHETSYKLRREVRFLTKPATTPMAAKTAQEPFHVVDRYLSSRSS